MGAAMLTRREAKEGAMHLDLTQKGKVQLVEVKLGKKTKTQIMKEPPGSVEVVTEDTRRLLNVRAWRKSLARSHGRVRLFKGRLLISR